jgi:hypothetical protein
MNNKDFGKALKHALEETMRRTAQADVGKVCRRCEKVYFPADHKYLCGYGKCQSCCDGECGHSLHPNPQYREKK